jgi:hypothetical protein
MVGATRGGVGVKKKFEADAVEETIYMKKPIRKIKRPVRALRFSEILERIQYYLSRREVRS